MRQYEPWKFCKTKKCMWFHRQDEIKVQLLCAECPAFQFHQYLRENNQILEADSKLAKVVAEAERLREENEKLKARLANYESGLEGVPDDVLEIMGLEG